MNYTIRWSAPKQGTVSTEIDAINSFAAREQFNSLYSEIDGISVISVTPTFKSEELHRLQSESVTEREVSGYDRDISFGILMFGLFGALILIAYGAFTAPGGIITMIIGGGLGFLTYKFADALATKGW